MYRPLLTVEILSGANIGRCLNRTTYNVTSKYPLDGEQLGSLRDVGVLGCGQYFSVVRVDLTKQRHAVPAKMDWIARRDTPPSGYDNPEKKTDPYFVYECVDEVDSSD